MIKSLTHRFRMECICLLTNTAVVGGAKASVITVRADFDSAFPVAVSDARADVNASRWTFTPHLTPARVSYSIAAYGRDFGFTNWLKRKALFPIMRLYELSIILRLFSISLE